MRGRKIFGVVALACLTAVGVATYAQRTPSSRQLLLPQNQLPQNQLPKNQANPQKNPGGNKNNNAQPGRRMGEWLEAHKSLPPDQQEKALESDPGFKKLPPLQQAALRERLRHFNSLTPEQRDRAVKRMQFMAGLSQQQRQQIRESNQQLQTLPVERRVMVHKALRHMRQMDPQEREQLMQSDRFKSTFSDQEQGILRQLSAINPPEEGGGPGGQPK
jgi:hypothetical protein